MLIFSLKIYLTIVIHQRANIHFVKNYFGTCTWLKQYPTDKQTLIPQQT